MIQSIVDPSPAVKPPHVVDFKFEHRVFSTKGCVFRKACDGTGVAMHVQLDNLVAVLPIETLRPSFNIPNGSMDDLLLDKVVPALKFVRQIRPGDSIPTELINGRATWLADEKHRHTAQARTTKQLIAWMNNRNLSGAAGPHDANIPDSPEMRRAIQDAFNSIAVALGFGVERRADVVDLVDRLAQEMSYIEALRDQFSRLWRIPQTLKALFSAYRRERSIQEEVVRCKALLARPMQAVQSKFAEVDANTGEILPTLRNFNLQIAYIRKSRDELWEAYLIWEPLLNLWEGCTGSASPAAERAIRDTYKFAARHFPQTATWIVKD